MNDEIYNAVDDIYSHSVSFFYDLFEIGVDYLIYLEDLTQGRYYNTDGHNYVYFSGSLLAGSSPYVLGEFYDFYFTYKSFRKSLRLYCRFPHDLSVNKPISIFLWLNRTTKKKLLFNHNNVLIRNSFNYESEKYKFINQCIQKGLPIKNPQKPPISPI